MAPGVRFIAIVACLFAVCTHDASVRIGVDFTSRVQWRYAASVDISGFAANAAGRTEYTGALICRLTGAPRSTEPQRCDLSASDCRVSSDFLNEAQIRNLVEQFQRARYILDMNTATIAAADTTMLPVFMIGEWDLFRSFAKALPALPGTPVSAGSSWEREKTLPIGTVYGNAAGHLYQRFTVDSVYRRGDDATMAAVSWTYSYRIEPEKSDTAGMFAKIPLAGKGRGAALFNIAKKCLESAQVSFETDTAATKAGWRENVALKLEE
jgi:hypothetical protein